LSDDLRALFLAHVCQTSCAPLGITVTRAAGSTVWDTAGRPHLDLLAGMGVANVGHGHPEVLAAVRAQAERHLHVMVYGEFVQAAQVRLAARLAELLPDPLDVVYFTSTGAEAIEGALKTARKHTGRPRLVAFEGGFHGDTLGALSVGGNPVYQAPFEPLLPEVRILPFDDPGALTAIDERTAAVVVEPVQAEAGVRIPRPGFLEACRRRCDQTGALLVLDEVVTGLGRTGRLFAFEHEGVVPDLLVLAKALGGGLPLGAFVGPRKVMQTLAADPPLAHVTTFGGHPLSCAAGLAALEVLVRERLPERAAALGGALRDRLRALVGRGGLRAVRGLGCLLGMEFADAGACARFARRALEAGLVLNWTLHRDTVVRLTPPLVLTDAEVDRALAGIGWALGQGNPSRART
jgi:acetylornithine/succinyldiaminopimelate/putrescine aminotransferase